LTERKWHTRGQGTISLDYIEISMWIAVNYEVLESQNKVETVETVAEET